MYDYVIVGAGSAGCVLANRLTEDPDVSVLVIEAGPPDTQDNVHVPLGFLKLGRTEVDWDFSTAPEPFCDGRRVALPRGKVLGGSSSINAMVYIRGNPLDYDAWGIPGWTWDDLLPYFLRSEDNERGASDLHGAGGPLGVSENRSGNLMSRAWVEAAIEAGLARNDDFNGPAQDGAGMYQVTQRGGMRCSAAVAYLHPAMERPNLTVEPYMLAQRILFDGTRAVGVEAKRLGEVHEFRAEREVLLCGGAYNSPQLLQLSGIGPAEHLELREVPLVLDQPEVGENLSDHASVGFVWTSTEPASLLLAAEPAALEEFEAEQTGPLTSNFAEAGGFIRTDPSLDAPDIQFHAVPVQIVDEGMADPIDHGMWMSPCLLTPESRGQRAPGLQRPDGQAGHPPQLLRRGGRHAAPDRGHADAAGHRRPARAEGLLRRAVHRAGGRRRRGAARARRPPHAHAVPPGGHVRDGRGRRRRAARAGRRGAAGRRRVGHAEPSRAATRTRRSSPWPSARATCCAAASRSALRVGRRWRRAVRR